MDEIDWNTEFAQLAADRLEADKATAVMMQRSRSIEREHQQRGRDLAEKERLRRLAVRLCRSAGAKVRSDAFNDRTKNQLVNLIREAQAVISGSQH